jgi:hypothetical protein
MTIKILEIMIVSVVTTELALSRRGEKGEDFRGNMR